MSLDATEGTRLIICAYKKDIEEKIYLKWINNHAVYEIPFEKYVDMHRPYRKSSMQEKIDILKRFGGG